MNYPKTMGERIDDLLKQSGKTLKVLAEEIGVSASMLSEVTNKEVEFIQQATESDLSKLSEYKKRPRQLRSDAIIKICKYFDVSADYILCLSDVKSGKGTWDDINKITGLSDKSITRLYIEKSIDDTAIVDFINYLILHKQFPYLIDAIKNRNSEHTYSEVFVDNDAGGGAYEIDVKNIYEFIADNLFREIISEYK